MSALAINFSLKINFKFSFKHFYMNPLQRSAFVNCECFEKGPQLKLAKQNF